MNAPGALNLPPRRHHLGRFSARSGNSEIVEKAAKHFDSLTFESFLSSYYLATLVVYSAACHLEGKEPDYFHPIHQVAGKLSPIGDFCPIKLVSMRRKF
jgi:hypothetical protein